MFEIFSLGRELDSSRDLAKSFEYMYNKVNDKLKIKSDKYQILEYDSKSLVYSRFVMDQEETMRSYPELDFSGMSVPHSIPASPTPPAVYSFVLDNAV